MSSCTILPPTLSLPREGGGDLRSQVFVTHHRGSLGLPPPRGEGTGVGGAFDSMGEVND